MPNTEPPADEGTVTSSVELPGPVRHRARDVVAEVTDRQLDPVCRELVEQLRQRCPAAFPPPPLKPSTRGPDVPLRRDELADLVRLAARDEPRGALQLWRRDGDELLVDVSAIDLDTGDGLVVVTIPVECDQTGRSAARVAFAIGSESRPAGMLATAGRHCRGPAPVVESWSEELIALAWRALTSAVTSIAREAGEDADGAGLVPFGMTANSDQLVVLTIARHAFDRVRP